MTRFIVLLAYLFIIVNSLNYYIRSDRACYTNPCDGSSSYPYDNIWNAISKTSNISSIQTIEYIFLKPASSINHYLLTSESNLGDIYTLPIEISVVGNIIIRPLQCGESPDPNLASKCLMPGEKIRLYLKTENISLNIVGNLTILNMIFDGSEDIAKYNLQTTVPEYLKTCTQTRVRCCNTNQNFPGIICTPNFSYLSDDTGLFRINSLNLNQNSQVILNGVEIQNVFLNSKNGFIWAESVYFINLIGIKVSQSFLKNGLVYEIDDFDSITTRSVPIKMNLQSIIISNMDFIQQHTSNNSLLIQMSRSTTNKTLFISNITISNIIMSQSSIIRSSGYSSITVTGGLFSNITCLDSNLISLNNPQGNLALSLVNFVNLTLTGPISSGLQIPGINSKVSLNDSFIDEVFLSPESNFLKLELSAAAIFNITISRLNVSSLSSMFIFQNCGISFLKVNLVKGEILTEGAFLSLTSSQIVWIGGNITNLYITGGMVDSFNSVNSVNISHLNFRFVRMEPPTSPTTRLSSTIFFSKGSIKINYCQFDFFFMNYGDVINRNFANLELNNSVFSNFDTQYSEIATSVFNDLYMIINNLTIANGFFKKRSQNDAAVIDSRSNGQPAVVSNIRVENSIFVGQRCLKFWSHEVHLINMSIVSSRMDSSVINPPFSRFTYFEWHDFIHFYQNEISVDVNNMSFYNFTFITIGVQNIINLELNKNVSLKNIIFNQTIYQEAIVPSHAKFLGLKSTSGSRIIIENITWVNSIINGTMAFFMFYENTAPVTIRNMIVTSNYLYNSVTFFIHSTDFDVFNSHWMNNNIIYNLNFMDRSTKCNFSSFEFYKNNITGPFIEKIIQSQLKFNQVKIFDNKFEAGSFLNGIVGSYFTFIKIEIYNNVLINSDGVLNFQGAYVNMTNMNITGNCLDEISGIMNIEFSELTIFSLNLRENHKMSTNNYISPTLSEKNSYLILLTTSTANFTNITSQTNGFLIYSLSTVLTIKKFVVEYLDIYQNMRQLLSCLQSTVKLYAVEIDGTSVDSATDRIIYGYLSTFLISGLKLSNFLTGQGNIFEISVGSLEMSDCAFSRVNSNPIIVSSDGSYFKLVNANLTEASHFLSSSSTQQIDLQYVSFFSSKNVPYVISATDGQIFNVLNLSILITSDALSTVGNSVFNLVGTFSEIFMKNIIIKNTRSILGPIQIFLSVPGSLIDIKNGNFVQNKAFDGSGVIKLEKAASLKLNITNCLFENNSALYSSNIDGGKGGSLYLSTINDTSTPSIFYISRCLFLNNFATIFGGAIYVNGIPPMIDDITKFEGNKAGTYDNHLGSQAISLFLTNKTVTDSKCSPIRQLKKEIIISNVGSGLKSLEGYSIILIDLYGQPVLNDFSSTILLTSDSHTKLSANLFQAVAGAFSIDNLTISSNITSHPIIEMTTNGIIPFLNLNFSGEINIIDNYYLNVSFRPCGIGEYLDSDFTCKICAFGTTSFQLTPNFPGPCIICDSSKVCFGGNEVVPSRGYSRLNRWSDVFLKCIDEDACLGGQMNIYDQNSQAIDYSGFCSVNYQGIMCSQCKPGLQKLRDLLPCFECKSSFRGVSLTLLSMLSQIIIIVIIWKQVFWSSFKKNSTLCDSQLISILKIVLIHQQSISLILQIPTKWPATVIIFIEITKIFGSSNKDVYGLECLIDQENLTLHHRYLKFLIANFVPFFLYVCLLGFILIYMKLKRSELNFRMINPLSIFIIWYYTQFTVIKEDLSMISCLNLYRTDDPIYYLESSKDIKCNSDHLAWFFGLGFPFTLLFFTFGIYYSKKLKNNEDDADLSKIGLFVREGFTNKRKNWEFVRMVRIYAMILGITLGVYVNNQFRLYLLVFVILVIFLLQERISPFSNKKLQKLEELSLATLLYMLMIGIFFNHFEPSLGVQVLFSLILIALSLYFYMTAILLNRKPNPKVSNIKREKKIAKSITPLNVINSSPESSVWDQVSSFNINTPHKIETKNDETLKMKEQLPQTSILEAEKVFFETPTKLPPRKKIAFRTSTMLDFSFWDQTSNFSPNSIPQNNDLNDDKNDDVDEEIFPKYHLTDIDHHSNTKREEIGLMN